MNKNTIFYKLSSKYERKYIHGEVLNGHSEEDCKVIGIPYRKPKYKPLPNFTNYEEWKDFDGTLYLGIQSGKMWGDIVFTTGPDFIISERLKNIFEKEGVTGYRLYNVEFPKNPEAPKYWGVIPNGNEVKGFFEDKENGESDRPFIIYPSTWDGKDFVRGLLGICIGERLKNILEKNKIENINITPMDGDGYRYING